MTGAMQRLNFNHLRYFWAVAHEGNLTRAARQLHVSPSAVSVQIQRLEDDLGHALFERRGKRLVLTEAGRIALDHADVIFRTGHDLVGTLGPGDGRTRRILRLGSVATLSRNFQLRFVQPLLGRDDVEMVFRSGGFADLLRALESHGIDVVLATSAPPRDAATPWVAHAIAEQPVSLVGVPDRVPADVDFDDLIAREPLVLPTIESSVRVGFDAFVERRGVRPRIAAEVDDMAMLRLLAREDVGLAVVPSIVVKDELEAGTLVEIERFDDLQETFFAITLTRRFPNPLLRGLLESAGERG